MNAHPHEIAPRTTAGPYQTGEIPTMAKPKILVIEDERALVEVLAYTIWDVGCKEGCDGCRKEDCEDCRKNCCDRHPRCRQGYPCCDDDDDDHEDEDRG